MHQEFIITVQLNFSKQNDISIISWLTGARPINPARDARPIKSNISCPNLFH
jgi:hypothetical protein